MAKYMKPMITGRLEIYLSGIIKEMQNFIIHKSIFIVSVYMRDEIGHSFAGYELSFDYCTRLGNA